MIGQHHLKHQIDTLTTNNTFPRFSIIVGPEGSGKKLMSKHIATKLGAFHTLRGVGVDDVRDLIQEAYKVSAPIVYVVADADKMSPAAKNALLKVTEEPPKQAYIILTLTDLNNTINTIRSRGQVFYMDSYTVDNIDEYYKNMFPSYADERHIITDLCVTPGEVELLMEMGPASFYEYVEKVVDNIAEVSGANSFKIAQKIAFKDTDEDKYDLKLFWKAFMTICSSRLREDPHRYAEGIKITSKYLQELRITGINKASTFDMWLLDIRKEWM
jgi:replication-associated recombination protein RarA